jgi:predicted acyltransferase
MALNNRYTALDVFRGLTICLMILVNTPGNQHAIYSPLQHADWHGFTPADLVYPSFLFAVGNALCFAVKKWDSMTQAQVLIKIFKRSLLLFLLGFLLYWFPFVHKEESGWVFKSFSHTRVLGVLQRIALCYCFASLLIYYAKPKGALIAAVFLLIGYQFILLMFGVPGRQYTMAGNAAMRLDLWVLGPNHMNHAEVIPWEPEGILGTLPAIANVIAGFWVGRYIQLKGKTMGMLVRLILTGCTLTALAFGWNIWFPINKNLWSSSFVLLTAGLDCIILAVIMYVTDFLRRDRRAYFFEVFGKNALFIYLLSEVMAILMRGAHVYKPIYDHIFKFAGMYLGSLLFAICFMLACWLAGWYLDKRKIYIRV